MQAVDKTHEGILTALSRNFNEIIIKRPAQISTGSLMSVLISDPAQARAPARYSHECRSQRGFWVQVRRSERHVLQIDCAVDHRSAPEHIYLCSVRAVQRSDYPPRVWPFRKLLISPFRTFLAPTTFRRITSFSLVAPEQYPRTRMHLVRLRRYLRFQPTQGVLYSNECYK